MLSQFARIIGNSQAFRPIDIKKRMDELIHALSKCSAACTVARSIPDNCIDQCELLWYFVSLNIIHCTRTFNARVLEGNMKDDIP